MRNIIIAGSASFYKEALEIKKELENKKYNVIDYPRKINDSNIERIENMQKEYEDLNKKFKKERQSNNWLKYCLKKTIECSAILLDLSKERMKSIVNKFIKESRKNERRNDGTNGG